MERILIANFDKLIRSSRRHFCKITTKEKQDKNDTKMLLKNSFDILLDDNEQLK